MAKHEDIKNMLSKGQIPTLENVQNFKQDLLGKDKSRIEILDAPMFKAKSVLVSDFKRANREKYLDMKQQLMQRKELQNAISISRAPQSNDRNVSLIAMVSEINKLPTGTYRIELEDLSGKITAIVSSKNKKLVDKIKFLTNDEVLGFIGGCSRKVFFINDVVWPDIPHHEISKTKEDVYVAFLSDIHVGSNKFLKSEFEKLISWFSGEFGSEREKQIADKTKYILLTGDVVDGVGVYPNQDSELHIKDILDQYKVLARYLFQIPKDKKIIISPGNHDGVRLEEPKPILPKEIAGPLYELPNVFLVTNPCLIKLHRNKNYKGLDVLMYHGDSFDFYVNNVDALRMAGGYDSPEEIHKFLLKRRSLSPTHEGMEQLPLKRNSLIIRKIPDVLATGHIHKSGIGHYKGVLTISSSCFQDQTSFQEKLGHHPDPGKLIVLNLKNLKIHIVNFLESASEDI